MAIPPALAEKQNFRGKKFPPRLLQNVSHRDRQIHSNANPFISSVNPASERFRTNCYVNRALSCEFTGIDKGGASALQGGSSESEGAAPQLASDRALSPLSLWLLIEPTGGQRAIFIRGIGTNTDVYTYGLSNQFRGLTNSRESCFIRKPLVSARGFFYAREKGYSP